MEKSGIEDGMMERTINKIMAVAASAWLTPAAAWAQPPYGPEWGTHPMWWMWAAWGIGMMLVMLLLWGAVIVGLVVGIRWLLRQGRGQRSDSALEILRQRYARGEINKDDFEKMKKDLQ
jgi:putative membrane protein